MSATILPFPAGRRPSSSKTPAQELDAIMLAQLPPGPARDVCQGIMDEVKRIRGPRPPATVHAFPSRPQPQMPQSALYRGWLEQMPPTRLTEEFRILAIELERIAAAKMARR